MICPTILGVDSFRWPLLLELENVKFIFFENVAIRITRSAPGVPLRLDSLIE
jgi:hypothetical protein